MELTDAINRLKESLADPTHKWGCEECKAEHEQLLEWLEDYKQLKTDYIDLDSRLRTANTEIDRLQSVSSWIPCSEMMPEKDMSVLISAQGHRVTAYYDSVKGVFMLTETEGLFYSMSAVTHWMPLPEPPQRKDDTHDND